MTQIIDDWHLENAWADEHTNKEFRQKILNDYYQRWRKPEFNPETHPWLFDPLSPPPGWKYDPYYELWIQK